MCAGSVPLWAHVRNRARRDKVGLACSVLLGVPAVGGTLLSAACLCLRSGEGLGGGLSLQLSAALGCSVDDLSVTMTVSKLSQNFLQLPLFSISLPCQSSLALHEAL